ncbi:bifunctional RNase H/acid phosphatase [Nocardioides sp.]|uniref:bifunctional RNase H/acid phosphatase n=1 Tax=Nocardioides sp. TaxID=35761 RepID=UPI002BE50347|nr:bifunctional RNase H/acid phosphatase [Nocardioides sp.]HVX53035.1 bifunctional RNase H/acid phosphatase [Nocardioides sp.]
MSDRVAKVVAKVVIEADGGSRGNPGPAAYGAVLRDAATGEVLAEDGTAIGVATNNVAEYRGLIAGLTLAAELAPEAEVEVRMDSKLVVEQMSGRWRIKHPDMVPLAQEAARLAPAGTAYTWIPRGQNGHADRLVNEALDGLRSGVTVAGESDESLLAEVESARTEVPARGWAKPGGPPTTLILLRHGVTPHTLEKRFSGGLASANPPLSDDGRAQIRAAAEWLAPIADRIAAVVTSPVRRTVESAEIAAAVLGKEIAEEPGFAEMEFGAWDGLTFAEVGERFPGELERWLGSLDHAPGGGESFRTVQERVYAGLDRLLDRFHGRTVLVVSHVTPIKTLVARALDADLAAVFRMELAPASVSVVSFYDDGDDGAARGSLRLYNALPPARDPFDSSAW